MPEATPTLTGRVRDYGMRTRIAARIPGQIPRVDALEAKIGAAGLDKKRGDHSGAW